MTWCRGVADSYLLFAVTGPAAGTASISAFVIEAGDPGLSFGAPERKMGLKGSPTTEVFLDDVVLPADRLVGRPGDGLRIALATLDRTRTTVAAQAVGIAQGALDTAVAYMSQRHQFGRPLAEFQGLQFMIADMAVAVRAARLLTHAAAAEIEAGTATMGAAGACRARKAARCSTTSCSGQPGQMPRSASTGTAATSSSGTTPECCTARCRSSRPHRG